MFFSGLALVLSLISVCIFPSCNIDIKKTESQLFAMDTVIDLTIYGDNADKAVQKCNEELVRLENLFSVTKKDSGVSKINASDGTRTKADRELVSVINSSLEISKTTGGCFDISVYPIVKLWGFTTDSYNVPSKQEINDTLKYVDYTKIIISGELVQLSPGMQIDLGGIAKGYAAQKIKEVLAESGASGAVVSLGGNVQTIGEKPGGGKWSVGIQNPDGDGIAAKIKVSESAVVTSGGYQRNFTSDGKTYHHIIDPKSGTPAQSGIISATVICDDPVLADGMSTALFVMGKEKAIEYYNKYKNIDFILIDKNGEFLVTDGIADSFEPDGKFKDKKVTYI